MQQREIKFRAWNGKDMSDPFLIDEVDSDRGIYCHPGWVRNKNPGGPMFEFGPDFPIGTCVLMQATGLKDKDGKEIYEGDLVTAKHLFQGEVREIRNVPVTFLENSGAFIFGTPKTGFIVWAEIHLSQRMGIEIVGNIYENPGLLEKK